jgi:REP element-mobilizing transposase RayT
MSMYHVYNRELTRGPMFLDADDRRFFKALFRRYLSREQQFDSRSRPYENLRGRVRLVTFCLMRNHFHVILFQIRPGGLEDLMKRVMGSYVQYFNKKYGRTGRMFDGAYRAPHLPTLGDKLRAIAYVHENHQEHCLCDSCGYRHFVGPPEAVPDWIDVASALRLFGGVAGFLRFSAARWVIKRACGSAATTT